MSPSDTQIREYFTKIKADFGDEDPVEVVRQGVLKVACGFHNGSAYWEILRHFGLAWFDDRGQAVLSTRGQHYLWNSTVSLHNRAAKLKQSIKLASESSNESCLLCSGPLRKTRYPSYGGDVFIERNECESCGNETWPKRAAN